VRHRPHGASDSAWIDTALCDYAARRAMDRKAIASVTAALPAVFASRFAPLAFARSAGLIALNLVPVLRDRLAHLLMFGVRAS
jgi:2-octaprenyl-6-methoxyphenol hydroxylase